MRSTRAVGGGRTRPIASYQAVLLYLSAAGPTDTARLARDLSVADTRMKGRMVALWEYGFVQSTGHWRLTPQGIELVRALRAAPIHRPLDPGPGVA
jgi:predicted ArsR family transcriptional regulator